MDSESRGLSDFLMCMLKWKPKDRASAREMLNHPWLKMSDEYGVWMIKEHLKEFKITNHKMFPGYLEKLKKEEENKDKSNKSSSSSSNSRGEVKEDEESKG